MGRIDWGNVVLALIALFVIVSLSIMVVAIANSTSKTNKCINSGYAGIVVISTGAEYCYRVGESGLITVPVSSLVD